MKNQLLTTCLAVLVLTATVDAGFISAVTKTNGNDACSATLACPNLDVVPLSDTALLRNDRTHTLTDVPSELTEDNAFQPAEIAEMIQLSNSDKDQADVNFDVTLSRLSVFYVGIDNRQFDNGGGTKVQGSKYSWMDDMGFTGLPSTFINTGEIIGVDENADGSANQYFTLFAAIAPAGTYKLGPHEGGGNNMYIALADDHVLVAPVPEPAALSLISLGLLGLMGLRKRNR